MKNMSIRTSILLPVIAVLIVGIFFMILIVSIVSSSIANDLSSRIVSARVNEYTNKFEALCVDSYGIVSALAPVIQHIGESSENPREEATLIMSDVLQANEELISIWTVWEPNAFDGLDSEYAGAPYHDATGRFIPFVYKNGSTLSVGHIPDYETGDFYLGAKDRGKPYITDPYDCEFGGKTIPVYTVSFPVIRNGAFAGAVGIDINTSNAINAMNAGSILDEGYLFVLSPDGTISTHRNSDLILKSYESTWLRNYKAEINSVLANGGNFSGKVYSDQLNEDIRFLVSGVMVGDTGRYWAVCGVVPERLVAASSTRLVRDVVLIGSILIAVAGLTVFLIVRSKLKRLPDITSAAEAMARGEISLTDINSGTGPTKNEIMLLGRAFSSMAAGINTQSDVMSKIANGDYSINVPLRSDADTMNRAINNMIDRTNGVMNEIRVSSSQVSSASQQIADGAQALAQGSTEQAAAVEELSSSISEISKKTKDNAELAGKTAKLADKIKRNAQQGSNQMEQMMEAVREMNEASQSIGRVIKVIDDIAFQINILSLNAAVEAARAGQQGKGFAVVAEEVRNLAAKSADAAKDTEKLIANSMEKAGFGSRIAGETSLSLAEIVAGISESSQLVSEIANSSEEQSAAIGQVNIGIEQVTQVIQQISATAEESAAASEEMSGQSDMLANMIAQFKLKATERSPSLSFLTEPEKKLSHTGEFPVALSDNHSGSFGKY